MERWQIKGLILGTLSMIQLPVTLPLWLKVCLCSFHSTWKVLHSCLPDSCFVSQHFQTHGRRFSLQLLLISALSHGPLQVWWRTSLICGTMAARQLGEDLKAKEPGCRIGPLKPIDFFEGNGITQLYVWKGPQILADPQSVCCPELLGFFLYIMMIFIYCGREERMRICHNLNRSNSTPVPLTAHLWLAVFYCPPLSGAAGQCVCVCVRASGFPSLAGDPSSCCSELWLPSPSFSPIFIGSTC